MKTLANYLHENYRAQNEAIGSILADIAEAGKQIAYAVQRSAIMDLHGAAGEQNVHAEDVQKLDEHTNSLLKELMLANDHIIAIASEEEEKPVASEKPGEYVVAFDPLDGSSNIDVNMPIGTIFSVLPTLDDVDQSFLQPASNQALAGYLLYSSSTNLVFSTGNGVQEFTLDPDKNEFVLTNENIKIPKAAGYIGYNSAHLPKMDQKLASAYHDLLAKTGLPLRYAGSMVADIHRTLLKGGLFAYPAVGEGDERKGKLRMQYECKPLGWLIEQAGGKALINGQEIGDLVSTELHQKVAIEVGDSSTMDSLVELLN